MAFSNYAAANNAQGTLQSAISAGAGSLILATGQGALFPTAAECPFFIKAENLDTALNLYRVLKREVIKVTNRVGDTLTITRSAGTCPPDYATLTQGTTAFSFAVGDVITQVFTAEHLRDIQLNKVNREDYQNQLAVYANDSGTANAYIITLAPAPVAYAAGQCFTFKALNTNTGASTINVNGLGVKTIKKYSSTTLSDLSAGDIAANQIIVLEYDGTNFQMTSNIPPTIPSEQYVMGESCSQGDAITTEKVITALMADSQLTFGNATGTQYQAVQVVGNGVAMTSIFAGLKKVGAPADNCILAIQADSAGSPSGTDLQTATIAGGTLTTTTALYNPSLAGSVTLTDRTKYWVVCRRSGALDAVNYYQLAVHTDDTVAFPYKTNNAGAYGAAIFTETHSISGAGIYAELAVRARSTVGKLSNVKLYAASALSQFAQISETLTKIYTGPTVQPGRQYYLTDTAGIISLTAGTVKAPAGQSKSSTQMKIVDTRFIQSLSVSTGGDLTTTVYSSVLWQERHTNAEVYASGTSGSNVGGTGYLEWSTDLVTWTAYGPSSGSSGATWAGTRVLVAIQGGVYLRARLTTSSASGSCVVSLFA